MFTGENIHMLNELSGSLKRILWAFRKMNCTFCEQKRQWYEDQFMEEVKNSIQLIEGIKENVVLDTEFQQRKVNSSIEPLNVDLGDVGQLKEFTESELSYYDGTTNKPAYVAVNGKVYDVSLEATWAGASHFGLIAGKDVSEEFKRCHNNAALISKLKLVGTIVQQR